MKHLSVPKFFVIICLLCSVHWCYAQTVTAGATDTSQSPIVSTGLDQIVVTASFVSRSAKDAPISMTVLNREELETSSFNSQADILRTIPGITAEGGGGEVASNVFVRGMPSGGQYQFTPLQVDGLPTISTFGLNSSAHDVYFRNDIGIRSLEFVRGGASTLFGAGSVAGIINYISVTGTPSPESRLGFEWAAGGRYKTDFLTAGPLGKNLFYAFSGFYRYDEGPLETGLATQGYQIRGNLKKVFNKGKSSFMVYVQAIDDKVQFYLPYPLSNNNGKYERPKGNDGKTIYTLLTSAVRDFSFSTANGRFETPIENGVSTKGGYIMAQLQHRFGLNWKLSSKVKVSNYDHWFNLFLDGDGTHNVPETQASYLADRKLPSNATFTYVDNGRRLGSGDIVFENRILDRQRPMEEIVGEINLTKKMIGDKATHNITIGTFLSSTSADDNNWIWRYLGDFSNAPRMVTVNYEENGIMKSYADSGFISGSQTSNNSLKSAKLALYLADQITVGRFNLDIGVRWEIASGQISKEQGVGTNRFNRGSVSTSDFALALAALYKVSDRVNLYLNGSKGYFFPELRGVSFSSPGVPQSYETEKIYQGELGTKIATPTLQATGAFFFVLLNDRRSVDFENAPGGGIVEKVNVQSTSTVGLELTANYQVAKNLFLDAAVTYQNHQFTKVEANKEQEGNWLRRQPQFKGTLGASYNVGNFDINASYTYIGKRYANDANTVELDAYGLTRAGAGYAFPLGKGKKESLRLGISVFNLFGVEGVTEGSPRQGNSQTGNSEYFVGRPILPARLMVRLLFSF